ncbi:hypothetical protein CDAR_74321 [Caerostris darwini]|uniref:Uncharacterized protein n=1 Tax=Caerostris darwini TaxID=1538125 RepID=A0AAV4UKF6_9ARAC|nr:hypothetical protein CDAR_74321 [Caerostris darwini]
MNFRCCFLRRNLTITKRSFPVSEHNQDHVSNSSHNSIPGSLIRPFRSLRKLFFDRSPLPFKTFESIQLQPICGNLVSSLNGVKSQEDGNYQRTKTSSGSTSSLKRFWLLVHQMKPFE